MADQADDLSIPMNPARPMGGATVPPPPRVADMPRPGGGPAPALSSSNQRTDQAVAPGVNSVEARKLIVGQGISLSGDIASCDRLVVEGSVQANLQTCEHMTITECGLFNGNASIDDAEISGRFEGDLVVHKRLLIRASGHVSGTVTYGEIEIEAGGRISGAIQADERPGGRGTFYPPRSVLGPAPAWIPGEATDTALSRDEA